MRMYPGAKRREVWGRSLRLSGEEERWQKNVGRDGEGGERQWVRRRDWFTLKSPGNEMGSWSQLGATIATGTVSLPLHPPPPGWPGIRHTYAEAGALQKDPSLSWKDLVRGKLREKAPHIGSGPQLGSCKNYFFVRAEDTARERHLGLL